MRRAFLIVFAALFVLLLDGNLPTPLYAVYRERFGFSDTGLTLIFATYTIVLIPSLLVFGQLSDRVGRRRVLVGGLAGATVGLLLFAFARSTGWLFVARAVQGVSLGAVVGTAAAALVETEPGGDHRRAALAAVLGQSGGSAAGPLIAGSLAEWAPPHASCVTRSRWRRRSRSRSPSGASPSRAGPTANGASSARPSRARSACALRA